MTLSRQEVTEGLQQGLSRFEQFIRGLDDQAWSTPTRCEGWVVRDVAAHVAGTMTMITEGRFDEFADPDHVNRQTGERKDRSPQEIADELRDASKIGVDLMSSFDDQAWAGPAPGGITATLGEGVEAIWYDAYLHLEDMKAALGQSPERGTGLKAAVEHVATILEREGWGPAVLDLDGLPERPVGSVGPDARRITGDPLTFVLVATGREDPSVLGLDETVNIYRPQ